ncbi:putative membrane protein [Trichinella pseudospiralis]
MIIRISIKKKHLFWRQAHDGFTTFKVCYSLFNFYAGWHLLLYYVLHKPVIMIQVYCVSICALLCLLISIFDRGAVQDFNGCEYVCFGGDE